MPTANVSYRVLYLDDDEDLTLLVGAVLGKRGFEVRCCGDTEAAHREADKGVDAVVADLRLENADGLQFCRELHDRMPELPIVVVTGDHGAREDVEGEGFRFLLKPVSVDDLERTLRAAITAAANT